MLTQNNTRFFPVCFTIFFCSEESRKKKSDRYALCDGGRRTRLLPYRHKHLHGAGIYEKDFNFHKKRCLRLTNEMACDKIVFVSILKITVFSAALRGGCFCKERTAFNL